MLNVQYSAQRVRIFQLVPVQDVQIEVVCQACFDVDKQGRGLKKTNGIRPRDRVEGDLGIQICSV